MKTVHAILNEDGTYQLAEPVPFNAKQQHVLVTIVEEEDEEFVGGYPVNMLLARPALADWDRPEEDEAWKDYQDEAT